MARQDGRLLTAAACICYFAVVLGDLALTGDPGWEHVGVSEFPLAFVDLRSITTAWECVRAGVEVIAVNPCDPFQRPANYPSLWTLGSVTGLGEESTVPLGFGVAIVFLVAALAAAGSLRMRDGAVYAAALLSPAVMLGVERGNADLLVFAVLVAGLLIFRHQRPLVRAAALGLLVLAAILKLFPALAFGVAARQRRRAALVSLAAVVGVFGTYVLLTFSDIRLIYESVPRLQGQSYGAGVAADAARVTLQANLDALEPVAVAPVAVGLAVALALGLAWRARRPDAPAAPHARPERLDAFWAGASIYVGTWAAGHSFDYRLAFLLLTVPQLLEWSRAPGPPLPGAAVALAGVVAALWLVSPALLRGPWRRANEVFPPEEVLNGLLAAYLLAALIVTVPPWLRFRQRPARADDALRLSPGSSSG